MHFRLLILLALACACFTSCKKDACKDVVCLNNGICVDGNCQCEPGFEGNNCETQQRLAFVNVYMVQESCNLGTFNYQIEIDANSTIATEINISNFGDFGYNVNATVAGTTFIIPEQIHSGAAISGSGELNSTLVTINYMLITAQADTLSCIMSCAPQ